MTVVFNNESRTVQETNTRFAVVHSRTTVTTWRCRYMRKWGRIACRFILREEKRHIEKTKFRSAPGCFLSKRKQRTQKTENVLTHIGLGNHGSGKSGAAARVSQRKNSVPQNTETRKVKRASLSARMALSSFSGNRPRSRALRGSKGRRTR